MYRHQICYNDDCETIINHDDEILYGEHGITIRYTGSRNSKFIPYTSILEINTTYID